MYSPPKERQEHLEDLDALMKKLEWDDFDDINEAITPHTLGRCKTNVLFTAFKVSGKLQCKACDERPDVEELKSLADSVNEFTTSLIDPLKSDKSSREAFSGSLDSIIDEAIQNKQMKFLSHPVVYTLLDKRWRGRFYDWKRNFWKWSLLRIWCLFQAVLFPLVFGILFLTDKIHWIWIKKRQEFNICFILNVTGDTGEKTFDLMKNCITQVIRKCGIESVNYCVVSDRNGQAFQYVSFESHFDTEEALMKEILGIGRQRKLSTLDDDLHEALTAFPAPNATKSILFLVTNDSSSLHGQAQLHGKLKVDAKELKEKKKVHIVPIAIGDNASVDDLKEIANPDRVISCEVFEIPSKLKRRIIQELYGASLFELYLDLFTTPYFIFARDTLSYFFLLGLHVVICLSSSVITFSLTEFDILVFFVGRFVLELDQCLKNLPKETTSPIVDPTTKPPSRFSKTKSVALRMVSAYLSDRWNLLDMINLIIYLVTFILRMVTWGISASVLGNRLLVIAQYFYGLNATILTVRVFGGLLEASKGTGTTHIALVRIVEDVAVIFVQFMVGILACSLAMTKVLLAEKSFVAGEDGVLRSNGICRRSGFTCWFEIVKHLCWTLLGVEPNLEPFTTGDSPSDYIVEIIYAVFIISALILLVNMMIAVLSSTYERVESNSLREWSLNKAIMIRTYSKYDPIPVPWNLLSKLGMLLFECFKGCWCRCGRRDYYSLTTDAEDTSEQEMASQKKHEKLDRVLDKLKSAYFATYGSSFPLTDMSHMLIETRRNREMCNQIARKVFYDQSSTTKIAPVGPVSWCSLGIQIEGCSFTYVGRDLCKACKLEGKDFHGARYKQPFSERFPKLEVLIQEDGGKRELVVGVVKANHNLHKAAGQTNGTIGYYTCDGHLQNACDNEKKDNKSVQPEEGKMAYRGDSIVCLIDYRRLEDGRVPLVFTLNGALIYEVLVEYPKGKTQLYPFIGMGHKGIRVLAKVCSGLNEVDKKSSESQAVAKLKESMETQFQKLRQKIADVGDVIVFSPHTLSLETAPTGSAAWNSAGLQIEGLLLTYGGQDFCKACRFEPSDFHGAKYKKPFSENFPRLEVLLKDGGEKRELVVGVVRERHNLHESAGEVDDTIGYQGCDGRILNSSEKGATGAVQIVEGKEARQGDLIACVVEFGKIEHGHVPVVFTLNGEVICEANMKYEKGKSELYPFIGMGHQGIRVLAKVCPGKSDDEASSSTLGKAASSDAIGEIIEEKQKQTQAIIADQQKQINDVSNSLSEVLQILRDMSLKFSSDKGSDTE